MADASVPQPREFRVNADLLVVLDAAGKIASFQVRDVRRIQRTDGSVRVPGTGSPVPLPMNYRFPNGRVRTWDDADGRVAAVQVD